MNWNVFEMHAMVYNIHVAQRMCCVWWRVSRSCSKHIARTCLIGEGRKPFLSLASLSTSEDTLIKHSFVHEIYIPLS